MIAQAPVTTIKLSGRLGREFGRVHRLRVYSPADAVKAMDANTKGRFSRYLAQHSEPGYHVVVGKHDIGPEEFRAFHSSKVIRFIPVVAGANFNSPWVQVMVGALIIYLTWGAGTSYVAGWLTTAGVSAAGAAAFSTALMGIGMSLAFGGVSRLLAGDPKINEPSGANNKPSYLFDGPVNTNAQGYPVPLFYGELLVGSAVVSASLLVEDFSSSNDPNDGFRFTTDDPIMVTSTGTTTPVNVHIRAAGGDTPYVFTIDADSISAGWSIGSSSGMLQHSGATLGDHPIIVYCEDDGAIQIEQAYTVRIANSDVAPSMVSPPTIRGSGGGGGGGGAQHTPVEAPDNLHSKATAKILDLICDGPIVGLIGATDEDKLKSIYLNGTPIANADGSKNFEGISIVYVNGTPDQVAIPGFDESENTIGDGRRVKYGLISQSSPEPKTISINDLNVDAVKVTMGIPSLTKSESNGDLNGNTVSLNFYINATGSSTGNILVKTATITGKTTSNYEFSTRIQTKHYGDGPWIITIERTTADAPNVQQTSTTNIDSYSTIIEQKFTYKHTAMCAITVDAKSFTSLPARAYKMRGRIIQVPDNYDPETRTYTGSWGGDFKPAWTDNPAWVLYDMITDKRAGLGDWIDPYQVDVWALYAIAQYCDELVDDGKGGTEPRYTCNLYLQSQEEAFNVINNLCSIFRGMAYWASGSVFAAQDRPSDPVYVFTNSNVKDGVFSYTGSSRRARHNAILVGWNDPADGYRQKFEYVANNEAIASLGHINQLEEAGFGCISQGQAHRQGRWKLYTEMYEDEVVSFSPGYEGLRVKPGDIILVQDQDRTQHRMGGRFLASDGSVHTLDAEPPATGTGYVLWAILPSGQAEMKAVTNITGAEVTTTAFSEVPGSMAQWILSETPEATQYRVLGIIETSPQEYAISALRSYPEKYALVESNLDLNDGPNPGTGGPGGPGGGGPSGSSNTPTGLTLTSYSVTRDDTVETNALAAWSGPAQASGYTVQWRKGAGSWSELVQVSSATAELKNVVPDTYTVRVASIVNGVTSPWAITTAIIAGDSRDDYITAAEKPALVTDWANVGTEKASLEAQAAKAGVSLSSGEGLAYENAYTDLNRFLTNYTGYVYTVNSIQYPVTGWNTVPGETVYLGRGGWRNWEGWWSAYYTAAENLKLAILNASLDPPLPTETIRWKKFWNISKDDDQGWTSQGGSAANVSPSSDADYYTARVYSGAVDRRITGLGLLPGESYVVAARVKLNSGTWLGKVDYNNQSTNYKQIGSPKVGVWTIVAWDMRSLDVGSSDFMTQTSITQLDLKLLSSGSVTVDWIGVGVYGGGSRADWDNAINQAITDLIASGNATILNNVIIGNPTNIFPNPNSSVTPDAGSFGAVAYSTDAGYPGGATGCRKLAASAQSPQYPTPKYQVNPGDGYYFSCWMANNGAGTVEVWAEFDSGGPFVLGSNAANVWTFYESQIVVPANATWMRLSLRNTNGSYPTYGIFDTFVLRKATEGRLIIDGSVLAKHLAATIAEAWQFRVGPWYRFFTDSTANTAMTFNNDGGWSRPSAGGYVGDPTRTYPARNPMRYGASFWNDAGMRSIICGLSAAFGSTSTAYELRRDPANARYGLFAITDTSQAGSGGTQKGSWYTLASPGTNPEEMVLRVFNPSSPSSTTPRIQAIFDGVVKHTWTHNDLGSPGMISGFAGAYLAATALRMGLICFGPGNIMMEGGKLTADMVEADTIKTPDYAEDGSGNPTAGAKMYVNEQGPAGVAIKSGPGGIQVGTAIMNQASMRKNMIQNGQFANWLYGSVGDGFTAYDWNQYGFYTATINASGYFSNIQQDYNCGGRYYALTTPAFTANNQTLVFSEVMTLSQGFSIAVLPPADVYQPHLKFKYALIDREGKVSSISVTTKVYLVFHHTDGSADTSYLLDTFTTTTTSSYGAASWTDKDYNVSSTLQAQGAGNWELVFYHSATVTGNGTCNTAKPFWWLLADVHLDL